MSRTTLETSMAHAIAFAAPSPLLGGVLERSAVAVPQALLAALEAPGLAEREILRGIRVQAIRLLADVLRATSTAASPELVVDALLRGERPVLPTPVLLELRAVLTDNIDLAHAEL